MVFGFVCFSGLFITFLVYIFGDEDSTVRLFAVGFACAFSGIVCIFATMCAFYHGATESPLSTEKASTGIVNKLVQHPVLARFLSTTYMVSVSILLVLGQIIADTTAFSRQPQGSVELIENELLHKEDQWLTIMFISSFVSLPAPLRLRALIWAGASMRFSCLGPLRLRQLISTTRMTKPTTKTRSSSLRPSCGLRWSFSSALSPANLHWKTTIGTISTWHLPSCTSSLLQWLR